MPEDDDKESVGRMRFSKTVPVITGVQEHQIVAAYYDYGNTTWYEYESGDKIFPTHWLKKATTPIVEGYSEAAMKHIAAISYAYAKAGKPLSEAIKEINTLTNKH